MCADIFFPQLYLPLAQTATTLTKVSSTGHLFVFVIFSISFQIIFTGLVVVVFTLLPETLIVQSFWLDGTLMGEQAGCQEIEKDRLR